MRRSAGIILVGKSAEGDDTILCLRLYRSWDLPKGGIEDGESTLEAALRETAEEVGITNITFPYGHISTVVMRGSAGAPKKTVTLFIGTTDQEPSIVPNPETGVAEQHACDWVTLDEAETMLHHYMRPCISWVRSVVAGSLRECLIDR